MPLSSPIHPGQVVWTGENPGILLKENPDGPFSAIALFFRIYVSPAGRGTVLLLLDSPEEKRAFPEGCNLLLHDNQDLAEYLLETFILRLPAFAALPSCESLSLIPIEECRSEGDPRVRYSEIIRADSLDIELVWDGLGKPTALELPPELTGGKENELYTLLIESTNPSIHINGRRLPGSPVERVQAGIKTTTAFLYFSETWIRPA
ncbi:MAG TPA: hypothetical protein DCW50_02065 [Gammaproteobacteria bacterium]|jgi:hypothetical protein|nr:hypothetical protein [Gammaproteobacteria bacterium]|tara:strand:- start:2987 stop:3604 length:618 start_codon:yes stop_codon:yes gene_type:complete